MGLGASVTWGGRGVRVAGVERGSGMLPVFVAPQLQADRPRSRTAMARFLRCMLNNACLDPKLDGILVDPGKKLWRPVV